MTLTPFAKSALKEKDIYQIGLVAAEWNYAEALVQLLIWSLAGVDALRGTITTTHATPTINLEVARTLTNELLVHEDNLELRKEILDALKRFDGLRVKRNTIVHSYWLPKDDPKTDSVPRYFFARARGELKVETQSLEESVIRATVGEITELIWRLKKAIDRLPKCPAFKPIEIAPSTTDAK